MNLGILEGISIEKGKELLALPTAKALAELHFSSEISVVEINPEFSDTATFCEQYQIQPNQAANCVMIETRRGEKSQFVACVVLATTRADVNGLVRRHLDARKASFASMDSAVSLTGMEYGAITPIGLPNDWPILIDSAVAQSPGVIIGSGIRKSKLIVTGKTLASLPNATILEGLGQMRS